MKDQDKALSSREFVGAVGAAGAMGALLSSGASAATPTAGQQTPFLDQAPDGRPIKAGLVGCGGRGTGAANNFLNAGANLQITALGDVFEDRLQAGRVRGAGVTALLVVESVGQRDDCGLSGPNRLPFLNRIIL